MTWPFSRRARKIARAAETEALAAQITASMERKAAREELRAATVRAAELARINERNHFSEHITAAFRPKGGPA